MRHFWLAFTLTLVSPAFAQAPASPYGNGVVNAAGQWAQVVGTEGARANRNAADQLFKQSLQHEAQGIATLNVGLLSQALTESQQGMKADDQARHFAQTALQALKSGNTAGNVDLAGKYGTTEEEMRTLANTSSPYLPAVQAKLDGYGIKVDHDNSVIKTPFGTFPVDANPSEIGKTLGKIAGSLGFSADGIQAGVQAAIANAGAIAQKAYADAKALGGAGSGRNVAGAAGADLNSLSDKVTGKENAATSPAANGDAVNGRQGAGKEALSSGGLTAEQDMRARTEAVNKAREEMMKKIGAVADALGTKDTDLFGIVHERYQTMRRQGGFNEYGYGPQKMAATLPR